MMTCQIQRRWVALAAAGVAALAAMAPAAAMAQSIAGVWRSQVEGTPSGMTPQVTSSDVQTMTLTADGRYQRQITVEGGNGVYGGGAAGNIVDSGQYRFSAPNAFQYQRASWTVCTAGGCMPGTPVGANSGTLPFVLSDATHATFLGLAWTRIQ
ncbi:MAG TPA: hypothetical protein VHW60_03100 [Caulobacteraceae bacterium]|jgi:opacity protein-like surface antigen|nr:hypothetical protein [Caulobacteraceae bacterium]